MLLSWEEARQECSYRGGYRRDGELASINTREEQTFMQSTSHLATTLTSLQFHNFDINNCCWKPLLLTSFHFQNLFLKILN